VSGLFVRPILWPLAPMVYVAELSHHPDVLEAR